MIIGLSYDRLYKLSLTCGLAVMTFSLWLCWERYGTLEVQITETLEAAIYAKLDLTSLQEQQNAIQLTLADANTSSLALSQQEQQHLQLETKQLQNHIASAQDTFNRLDYRKQQLRKHIFWMLTLGFFGCLSGALLALVGGFGWFYHVSIHAERRRQPRDDS